MRLFLYVIGLMIFTACLPLSTPLLAQNPSAQMERILQKNPLNLTPEQKDWLRQNPVVRIGVDEAFPPFEFVDQNGTYKGIAKDYLDLLADRIGVTFKRMEGLSWGAVIKAAKNRELDLIPVVTNTQERREFLTFSDPYLQYPIAIITRTDDEFGSSLKMLNDQGKTLALPEGYSDNKLIAERYPTLEIKNFENPEATLNAVVAGQADATTGSVAVLSYLIQKNNLINLKVAGISEMKPGALSMGVRKDWPIFKDILTKAFDDIRQDEHQKIRSNWMSVEVEQLNTPLDNRIEFSRQEEIWIRNNPVISVGVEEWFPFVRAEPNGLPGGIVGDFVKIVLQKTGLDLKMIPGAWTDLLNDFKEGKIDLLPGTYFTEERSQYGRYSTPYFSAREFLYVHEDNDEIRSFEDLNGKKIAIVKDFGTIPKIREKFPDIEIVETKDQLEAIYAVLNKTVDATFEAQIVFEEIIRTELITGLKPIGQVDFPASKLHFFSRADDEILQSILQKALSNITEAERRTILSRWLTPTAQTPALALPERVVFDQDRYVLKYMSFLFLGLSVAVLIFWVSKGRPTHLSIRDRLFLISFIYIGLIVAIASLVAQLLESDHEQIALEERKFQSLNLALELKQSSDELTRFARTYAITGDQRYEDMFRKVIQIRDGQIGHPTHFTRSYWDHVVAGQVRFDSNGEVYSIEGRMKELGLSEQEQDLLRLAKSNSDDLINLEDIAMNAVKGLYKDDTGQFTITGAPDLNMATQLLHGPEYHIAKSKIMKPLDDFFEILSYRTSNELNNIRTQIQAILATITLLTLTTIGFSIYVFLTLRTRIIKPLSLFEESAKALAVGHLNQTIEIKTRDEFGTLADAFNDMADAIYDRTRELNFQKYAMDRHAIVSATDCDGNITYVNDRFEELFEYKFADLLGENLHVLNLDQHSDLFYAEIWDTISTGNVWHGEISNTTRTGRKIWLATTIVPFLDNEGQPERYIAISTDITRRKETEEIILSNEQRLSAIFKNAVDGIIVIDEKGQVQSFSPAAQTIFGYSEEDVIGNNISMLMPSDIAREHDIYLSDFLKGKSRNVVDNIREVIGQRKDGSTFPMDLAVGVSKIGQERVFTGIVRDITVRKEVEATIERSEERTRLILSSIGEGVFGVDLDGRITFVNPQAEQMLGYSAAEMIGQKAHPLFHYQREDGADYPVHECWMYKSFTLGETYRIDDEVLWRKDGRAVQIEYNSTPIYKDEEIIGAVISFMDVSERRAAQRKLSEAYEVISSSITYASQIQRSALPDHRFLMPLVGDYFIWWEPRDVVGGDLYWVGAWGDGCLVILGDCTGHGVPGAFMTLISIAALERAMNEIQGGDVSRLITRTHQFIQTMLGQHYDGGETNDGIELGACYFTPGEATMKFAGARFDLYISEEDDCRIVKGNKSAMAYRHVSYVQEYDEQVIDLKPGQRFYMCSDGVTDQIGGERRRMYGKKRLMRHLHDHRERSMEKQKEVLIKAMADYQGAENRRDDIAMIGFHFDEDEDYVI